MKKLTATIVTAGLLASAGTANAGVVGTAFLELKGLGFVGSGYTFDEDGFVTSRTELTFEQLVSAIDINTENSGRTLTTSASYNGVGQAPLVVSGGGEDLVDGAFACFGASCGDISIPTNNSVDFATVVADDTMDYAITDAFVDGSALTEDAVGFTYADAAVSGGPSNVAAAGANIDNGLEINATVEVISEDYDAVGINFTALYDIFVKTLAAGLAPSQNAVANATASFTVDFNESTGTGAGDLGVLVSIPNNADFGNFAPKDESDSLIFATDDLLGTSTSTIGQNLEALGNTTFLLTSGTYQLDLIQDSTANASVVPAPASIALFGLGLLGLGAAQRKRKV